MPKYDEYDGEPTGGVPKREMPGSWEHLFAEVRRINWSQSAQTRINTLEYAVRHLIDACPDDNAVQVAARRGGRLASDRDSSNLSVQMLRGAALLELMHEAQKEPQSVSAYNRMKKALRMLGFDHEDAINLALHFLEYHTREGKPFPWLAEKLAATGRKK